MGMIRFLDPDRGPKKQRNKTPRVVKAKGFESLLKADKKRLGDEYYTYS